MLVLILSSGVCLADDYVGGIPLASVHSGTVSGGVYCDSYYGTGDQQTKVSKTIEKTFTVPDNADVEWAMLLTTVYCGHMQNNYQGTATVSFNGQTLGSETLNVPFTYRENGGDGYVNVNDHVNRVTSDYMIYYDVTNLVKSGENTAVVKTDPLDSSFDGRVKLITLVVAYNDGSKKTIWYQVNRGHDVDSYYNDDERGENYIGSTAFAAALPSGSSLTDAELTVVHMASTDGVYTFNGQILATGTPQGTYTGSDTWDVKDSFKSSDTNTLTYDRADAFYKNSLGILTAEYTGSQESAPIASFTASPTSGTVPLAVQFTDASTGTVSSYVWDFNNDGSIDSTEQNPSYTYDRAGTYSVNLTVTNTGGTDSELKTNYITVNAVAATSDLTISGVVNPVPSSAVFAKEANLVKVNNIKNNGTATLTNISVALYASDVSNGAVPVNTTTIQSLENGETATVTLLDPTIRALEGGSVIYTAVVDPENLVSEADETNNNKSSASKPVKYNGYKGKRYWEGGSDIATKNTYDLQGNLIYFTQPSSAYKAVGWTGRTETWTESNLPIPSGSTLEKAFLYVSYNWDTTSGGVPKWTATFNGHTLTDGTLYTDKSNFGSYPNQTYGLYVFDVTDQFNSAGNSLVMTPDSGNSNALYPSTLVVVYNNSTETRKQIFINEECDELGYSESGYGTTLEEATAYAPFTGMTIDVSNVQSAMLYSFAGSAGPNEGNLLFNGNMVATGAWQGDSSTSSAQVFDVKNYISATGNEAGIQGTESGGMDALQQILVIEYPASSVAPVANFTANTTNGNAPLDVLFTETSTGTVSSYAWDFDNDGSLDSTEQSPSHTYSLAGTYTVKLTVTGPGGSDDEVKTGYINVEESLPTAPVAAFTAKPTSGDAPLKVNFTDESTGTPTEWEWNFGDGTNTSEQNPAHTYVSSGNYTVNLTVSNEGGSNSTVKTDYITVAESSTPADQPDLIVSAITLNANEIFASEANNISANVENRGIAASGPFTIRFSLDGFDENVTSDGLAVGANATFTVTDPTIRASGDNVVVFVTADSENAISESNETNNSQGLTKTVSYNGYKGKRYTGGNDFTTQSNFEGRYGLVYSAGSTAYNSNNWTAKTYSWSSTDLPVPVDAKVVSARLYQPYTWNKMANDPGFTISFNSNNITPIATYKDRKNYGTYDYPSGLYVYNVTSLFDPAGNSITLTPETGNDYGMYGAYLVIIYEDPATNKKKIWINDEFDLLTSKTSYAVTSDEATAYSSFNEVNATEVSKATAIAILASGNDANKSKFYFNDQEYTGFWTDYRTTPQIGFSSYDVAGALQSGTDVARIQSYDTGAGGDSMSAMNTILVVEYAGGSNSTEAPVAYFTAEPTAGDFPLTVNFTDLSSGTPTSWTWDFGDGTSVTEQNVTHTYTSAGNYTVNLTVTNEGGSDSEVKTDYINVSESSIPIEPGPVAEFTSDVMSGTAPLIVNFTDQSTGSPTSWLWDFGDGSNTTEQNVSHTYTSAGIYTVNLTVANENGTNSTSSSITVSDQPAAILPVAIFSSNVTEGYVPLSVQFTDLSENATEWTWDFGDGESATEQNTLHTYTSAGVYSVNLTVANANGTDSKLATITISDQPVSVLPVANFSSNVTSGYVPLSVQFTDLSESATEWNWNFGDGTTSTEQNPVHIYGKKGKYTVKLTVKNSVGSDTATKSKYITVETLKAPAASFSASPTYGKAPLAVTFTDKSKGSPTSWDWSFGDGNTSTEQNPVHTYNEAGKYTVKLTVKNAAGSSTTSKSSYINVVNPVKAPTAAFSASPTSGYAPLQVTFTDKSTNSPTSWKWSFGDGTTSTEQNPVHIYSKAGTYTVNLTVKNSAGSSTTSKSSYISVANPLKAPTAAFSASPTSGKAPLTVTFTDKSKDSPASWKWNFGDGASSTEQNPLHTYSKAGKYTVKLTVKNSAGSSTTSKSSYINVVNPLSPPTAAFSASPISGSAPLKVAFTDKSAGSPASWKWSFGDGTSSAERNPIHTYSKKGKYTVKLTVKNSAGSSTKTMSKYIVVSKGK